MKGAYCDFQLINTKSLLYEIVEVRPVNQVWEKSEKKGFENALMSCVMS